MTWEETINLMSLEKIGVTIIKPLRKGEEYKTGKITGFKCGLWGGGWHEYKNGRPYSFSSMRQRFIKKPKVHVTYDVFTIGGKQHSDWVEVDNCEFNLKPL